MNEPLRVALIIETATTYGCRILGGIARYLRSHHRWSVFLEQRALGVRPPARLFSGKWDGILSRPTDPELARLFRKMRVPVVDLNDLFDDLRLPGWARTIPALAESARSTFWSRVSPFRFRRLQRGTLGDSTPGRLSRGDCRPRVSVSVYESPWRGADVPRWDKDLNEIARWLQKLPQPVAVMTCNDVRGLHVLDTCTRRAGGAEQVAVVGVDNEELLCELCATPLSSVAPDPEGIGYAAAELLDGLMAGKRPQAARIRSSRPAS